MIQPQSTQRCESFVNPHTTRKKQFSCLAVVSVEADSSYNLLRYDLSEHKEEDGDDDDVDDDEVKEGNGKESRKDTTDISFTYTATSWV